MKTESGSQVRQLARSGVITDQTSGRAPGYLQGNIVILPKRYASDFLLFCHNNPKPCPLIGLSRPGHVAIPSLGSDIDIRRDVPKYLVYRDGSVSGSETDISGLWADEMVAFVLGCSFTFERELIRSGYVVRHVEQGRNVPMFKTNIATVPGGVFSGPLVVTMRPCREDQIPLIFDLSAKFPHAHGAPIYWGDPERIGISDLGSPDFGDAVSVYDGEMPVFWACGVTPQVAVEHARPDLCITHAPGCMLVTDLPAATVPTVNASLACYWLD